jgi:hypothetical protein
MGFFNKIKQNLNHGGVKIELDAPTEITREQTVIPVKVTLVADQQCQIDSIEASLERRYVNAKSDGTAPSPTTFGSVKQAGPIALSAGQSQEFTLSITIPSTNSGGAAGQLFGKLANTLSSLNSQTFHHYICVKADVAKISLDPKVEQRVMWDGNEMPGVTRSADITFG